tara:strand:- start:58 stop:546 length:489 start_codon:yes stop_codon:yes gene_type:complete
MKNKNQEKKLLARMDVIKDALTAATTLMDEMLTHTKVFRDYEQKWVEYRDKPDLGGQLILPLPIVLLTALVCATKGIYGDPPGYTREKFETYLREGHELIDTFALTMFHVTLDSDHELEKIRDAYKGTSAEGCLDDVVGNATLHGGIKIKDWIKKKNNGSEH